MRRLTCLANSSIHNVRYAALMMVAVIAAHANAAEYEARPLGHGWQVATKHFVITCTLDREVALAAADQLESAWRDTASVADRFTDTHHRDRFGAGAIGVLIDKPRHIRARQTAPLAFDANDVVMIRLEMNESTRGDLSDEQSKHLRGAASRAFFHLAEVDQKLPSWVTDGLSQYVANRGNLPTSDRELAMPTTADERSNERYRRPTQECIPTHTARDPNAGRWIAYLLNGDDALHAPATLTAIRQTLDGRRGSTTAIDQHFANVSKNHDIAAWLEDPQVDQPAWEIPENQAENITNAQREMAVVLKLAKRFNYTPDQRPQVKIIAVTRENEPVSYTSPGSKQRPPSMNELHRKLTASGDWATSTGDGVLHSSDQRQLRVLLGLDEHRYTATWREGNLVLIQRLQDGTVIEGTLSENAENPRRPLAEFEVR